MLLPSHLHLLIRYGDTPTPHFSLHLSLTGAGSIPPTQTLQGVSNRGGAETAAGDGGGIGVGSTAAVLGVR